jgi:hypothetical protein
MVLWTLRLITEHINIVYDIIRNIHTRGGNTTYNNCNHGTFGL